jgi:hypothetical protein
MRRRYILICSKVCTIVSITFVILFSSCISDEIHEIPEMSKPIFADGDTLFFKSSLRKDTLLVTISEDIISSDKTYNYRVLYVAFFSIKNGATAPSKSFQFKQSYHSLSVTRNGIGGQLLDEYTANIQSEEVVVKIFKLTNGPFQPQDPVTLHYNERHGLVKYILQNGEEFEREF